MQPFLSLLTAAATVLVAEVTVFAVVLAALVTAVVAVLAAAVTGAVTAVLTSLLSPQAVRVSATTEPSNAIFK
jgi:acyl-coenzyme A synthetase/AMP-(fatty) acid ligase